ncbi:MAG: hypothetical protein ACOYKA_01035 [Legionellaceae bacterium]
MDALNQHQANSSSKKENVRKAAAGLLDEGKAYTDELYEEGSNKVDEVIKEAKLYSDDLLNKVRENPLKAVLIAGGVGLLLSMLLRK